MHILEIDGCSQLWNISSNTKNLLFCLLIIQAFLIFLQYMWIFKEWNGLSVVFPGVETCFLSDLYKLSSEKKMQKCRYLRSLGLVVAEQLK